MMESVGEIYKAALILFKDKERFTQGYFQKDKSGQICGIAEGYCFCALGVLQHLTPNNLLRWQAQCLLQRVSEYLYNGECIQLINDSEDGYDKVMAAFNFAHELWNGKTPTEEDLRCSVTELLKRNQENETA